MFDTEYRIVECKTVKRGHREPYEQKEYVVEYRCWFMPFYARVDSETHRSVDDAKMSILQYKKPAKAIVWTSSQDR